MEIGIVEESVKRSIRASGFPEKSVRLSFRLVFESCRNHNTSLKEVLENLREEDIFGTIDGDCIIFRPQEKLINSEDSKTQKLFDFSGIDQMELNSLEKMAREQLKNMSPEQIKEIRNMVQNISPKEKADLMKLFDQIDGSSK